jgi:hypothetical protein
MFNGVSKNGGHNVRHFLYDASSIAISIPTPRKARSKNTVFSLKKKINFSDKEIK